MSGTPGVYEIRNAAERGDVLAALRLQLEHMEPGTPVLTAFLMLNVLVGILDLHDDAETARVVRAAILRCGLHEAALEAAR